MTAPVAASAREAWGSRIGLILAMAGNAVGLGNFLRFPRQAVDNGGGTFMIPYFIAFVLVGIPLMWMEWGIGRKGGERGAGSTPGMFAALWGHPVAKYLGVLGIFMPLVVLIYYTYIESWTLAWTVFSFTGAYHGLGEQEMRAFLASYQNLQDHSVHGFWTPFLFFLVTLSLNIWIVSRGLAGGIERLAKVAMPLLFLFAALLVVRVLTLPPTGAGSPAEGLNFMYSPHWEALANPSVWLAAAGQIFFTLSVGMGTIHAYASYVRKSDDIVLSGLATCGTNETAEVVLGGSLAIPAVVTFFGVSGAIQIARAGGFDLGFVAMPLVFEQLPGGNVIGMLAGAMWFGLLFFAGITSSVAMATPCLSFMQEHFGWTRKRAALAVGAVALTLGLCHVVFYTGGFLDEWDYWAGTFGLVILALVESVLFMWVFGSNQAWAEIHHGAQLRLSVVFKYVMTYVTPVFLIVMMLWWTLSPDGALPRLLMKPFPESEHATRWASRVALGAVLAFQLWLIKAAWRRR